MLLNCKLWGLAGKCPGLVLIPARFVGGWPFDHYSRKLESQPPLTMSCATLAGYPLSCAPTTVTSSLLWTKTLSLVWPADRLQAL